MIDGKIVAGWQRTVKRASVVIEIAPFIPLDATTRDAIAAAAQRYGDFLGLPATLLPIQTPVPNPVSPRAG